LRRGLRCAALARDVRKYAALAAPQDEDARQCAVPLGAPAGRCGARHVPQAVLLVPAWLLAEPVPQPASSAVHPRLPVRLVPPRPSTSWKRAQLSS